MLAVGSPTQTPLQLDPGLGFETSGFKMQPESNSGSVHFSSFLLHRLGLRCLWCEKSFGVNSSKRQLP